MYFNVKQEITQFNRGSSSTNANTITLENETTTNIPFDSSGWFFGTPSNCQQARTARGRRMARKKSRKTKDKRVSVVGVHCQKGSSKPISSKPTSVIRNLSRKRCKTFCRRIFRSDFLGGWLFSWPESKLVLKMNAHDAFGSKHTSDDPLLEWLLIQWWVGRWYINKH